MADTTLTRRLLAAVAVLTLVHVSIIANGKVLLAELPGWIWVFRGTPLPRAWLLLPMLGAILAIAWAGSRIRNAWLAGALLVAIGVANQFAFAFAEGRGVDALRARALETGHAAFVTKAASGEDFAGFVADYDRLISDGALPVYPFLAKPPGHFGAYLFTARLAVTGQSASTETRLRRLATFMALTWPVLAALPALLLFVTVRRWSGDAGGGLAEALLFLTIPSVSLMVLHLDQCLYPLAALAIVGLFAVGAGRHWLLCGAAGVAAYLALFVTFSLVPLPAFLAAALWIPVRDATRAPAGERLKRVARSVGLPIFAGIAGFLLADLVFRLTFGYDIGPRFQAAMSFHQDLRITDWTLSIIAKVGVANLVEFAAWTGLPLLAAWGYGVFAAIRRLSTTEHWIDPVVAASAPVLLVLAFLTKTSGEVARLWLFMGVFLALGAGAALRELPAAPRRAVLSALVVGQFAVTAAIKAWMDFS